MPETQTIEPFDVAMDNNETGYENYEPISADNESESDDLPTLEGDEYATDPITADLMSFKGGSLEDWTTERVESNFVFDGKTINDESGKPWPGFTEGTFDDLRTGDYSRLDDIKKDGQLIVTYVLKGADSKISYEFRTTDIRAANDDEVQSPQDWSLEGAAHLITETPTYADAKPIEVVAITPLEAEQDAAVEVEEPEAVEEIVAPIILETQPQFEEAMPTIAESSEQHVQTEQAIEYSYADIAAPQEIQAQVFGEFLAMEKLPAINIEETNEPIILKAPEPEKIDGNITQPIVTFRAPEVPRESVATHEVKPHGFISAPTEMRVTPVIEHIKAVTEVIERVTAAESDIVARATTELPIEVKPQSFAIPEVQELELPIFDFKDELKEEAPVVIAQKEKPAVIEAKEQKSEVRPTEPKAKEVFRRRGWMEFKTSTHRPRHEETVEEIREEPRSIPERAVAQTLERFAAEMARERSADIEDEVREPVVEMRVVATNENTPMAEVIEEMQVAESTVAALAEQQPVIVSETPLLIREEEQDVIELNNVVPFPGFVRPETVAKTAAENIIEQFRLPRAASAPEALRTATENAPSIPARRPQLADVTNDNSNVRTFRKNGVVMSMPDDRIAA